MPGTGKKVRQGFRNFADKLRTSVSIKRHEVIGVFALMFILFLGLLIRIAPIFRAPPMIKEFDPWSQYRAIIYILQNGSSAYWSWHDTMSWYPEGTTLWVMRPVLIFAVVYAYQFLTLIGISTTPFLVDFYMPAVIGTLDILVVFLIGKELLDSRAGLLAAFFTAFDPGILQRTTAGFADTETFGILAVLLWFLFYIKAMKTGKMTHATMAGLSMIMLELSWGGSDLCQLLVPLLAVIFMLSDRFNDNVFMTSVVCTGCGLIAQVLNPENAGSPFAQSISGLMSGITFYLPLACFFLYFIYHWFYKQKTQRPKLYEGVWNIIKWGAIPAVAVFAILFWGFPNVIPVNIQGRLESILNPFLRGSMAAVSSVGEQMPAAWSVFYYNIIIPIFLIPVGVYFAMKRMQHADIALVAAVLITYFTTGSMIRIVVIFAPFAAIIGAFGLASVLNYFGNIGRKQVVISRRRKRQAKQTMGPADAAIVFVFVGVLMIAQVVQSVNIEVQQMSYSELVVGGQYQDWPEALAWMRQNLQPTSVVVSWWDYGDWTTVIGNVTSVNDNHTDNNTRMGTTGLAMMQPDEIESAKVFRFLHANYAMVYFGHLISGLGGDEGKWPWMLRIANEVTGDLESYGLRVTTGEGAWQANEPFDESQYYNSTSGLYSQKWFDSMLVKMMFYGEPTSVSEAQDQLGAYFAEQVSGYAGDSQTAAVQARKTADGRTWGQVIPDHGNYQFTCFNLAFESSNHLVKIFKLDYTALDTHVNATAPAVYSNGLGNVQVANTGLYPVTLGNVTIASESPTATPITASMPINANETSTGSQTLTPGESSTVWFNSSEPLYTGRGATVSVSATATGQFGQTFTVTGQAPQILVTAMPTPQIAIDRSSSSWWLAGIPGGYSNVMNITVQNVGPIPVKLNTITSDIYRPNAPPSTPQQVSTATGSFVVLPGQSTQAFLQLPVGPAPEIPNTVTVTTIEGAKDTVLMSNSTYGGYRLSILPETYTALPEGVAQGTIPIDKDYIPVTLGQSTAWGNQTVTFAVKNTGSYRLGLQDVYVTNGVWDPTIPADQQTPQTVDGSSLWLNPGDTRILQQTIPGSVNLNAPVGVYLTAIGGVGGQQVATTAGLLQVIDTKPQLYLFGGQGTPNQGPYGLIANANGTLQYFVKNDGNQSITLASASLNDTVFSMSDGTFYKFNANGTRYVAAPTLATQEVGVFVVNARAKGIRLNDSISISPSLTLSATQCNMGITDGVSAVANISIPASVSSTYSVDIDTSSNMANYTSGNNAVNLKIINNRFTFLTLEALIVNGTSIDITPSMVINPPGNLTIGPLGSTYISMNVGFLGGPFSSGTIFDLVIVTWEGTNKALVLTVP